MKLFFFYLISLGVKCKRYKIKYAIRIVINNIIIMLLLDMNDMINYFIKYIHLNI